jgi:hypothetical protein
VVAIKRLENEANSQQGPLDIGIESGRVIFEIQMYEAVAEISP